MKVETKIKRIDGKLEALKIEQKKLFSKIGELQSEKTKIIFDSKMYTLNLSEYEGKDISHIDVFDSNGDDVYLPLDEIVEVENGKLHCSSYQGGIVSYCEEREKYIHNYHYSEEELDIVGFYNIEVEKED